VPTSFIAEVFKVMAETPQHTYQLLTKRPRRLARMADSLPLGISAYTDTGVIGQPSQATKEKRRDALNHLGAAAGTLIGLLAPPPD
jgi:protein gp37